MTGEEYIKEVCAAANESDIQLIIMYNDKENTLFHDAIDAIQKLKEINVSGIKAPFNQASGIKADTLEYDKYIMLLIIQRLCDCHQNIDRTYLYQNYSIDNKPVPLKEVSSE